MGKDAGRKEDSLRLYRQWLMLSMIPRYPMKIDSATIENRLEEEGFPVSRRTVQKNLKKLSESDVIKLVYDEHTKPYGWSWAKDALRLDVPGMDPHTALTFTLLDNFTAKLLPRTTIKYLEPYIRSASRVLEKLPTEMFRSWPNKVRIVSRMQPLQAPEIENEVLDVVYGALMNEIRILAQYRNRNAVKEQEYEISPQGLVFADSVIYLVALINDYENPVLLSLHRFVSVRPLDKPATRLENFSLQEYIDSGELGFPVSDRTIRLKALFAKEAAGHLYETKLSTEQKLTEKSEKTVLLEATVQDTSQLRWWLRGFGDQVEILSPKKLRDEFAEAARKLSQIYKNPE